MNWPEGTSHEIPSSHHVPIIFSHECCQNIPIPFGKLNSYGKSPFSLGQLTVRHYQRVSQSIPSSRIHLVLPGWAVKMVPWCCEALCNMEEERQRFILARSKPTPRIGEATTEPGRLKMMIWESSRRQISGSYKVTGKSWGKNNGEFSIHVWLPRRYIYGFLVLTYRAQYEGRLGPMWTGQPSHDCFIVHIQHH